MGSGRQAGLRKADFFSPIHIRSRAVAGPLVKMAWGLLDSGTVEYAWRRGGSVDVAASPRALTFDTVSTEPACGVQCTGLWCCRLGIV